jgi:hypothetical protein
MVCEAVGREVAVSILPSTTTVVPGVRRERGVSGGRRLLFVLGSRTVAAVCERPGEGATAAMMPALTSTANAGLNRPLN